MRSLKMLVRRGTLLFGALLVLGSLACRGQEGVPSERPEPLERATYDQYVLWNTMWFGLDGTLRHHYSEPAGERVDGAVREVMARAQEKGFVVDINEVRQTTDAFHERVPIARNAVHGDPAMGVSYAGSRKIILNSAYVALMDDDELRFLVSHEIGHHVDHQTERLGERFDAWRFYSVERFADAFAAEMVGDDVVRAFNLKWVLHIAQPQ